MAIRMFGEGDGKSFGVGAECEEVPALWVRTEA